MLQNRVMYEQMQMNKRFDKGSHYSKKVAFTKKKKVVQVDSSSQNSEQQLQTHSRSRNKPQKNVDKTKYKKKRLQNDSSLSSKPQTDSNQVSSESSYKKNSQTYSYQNKYNLNSKESYNRIKKPSQTLIQKPQINDPQLDQYMEKILFKLAKQIKPKNRRRYGYEQPIHYDPSQPKAFSKDAFSFKEEPLKTIKQQYYNNPFMPPSLRISKGEKLQISLPIEYQMTLQQLPLKKTDPNKANTIKKQQKTAQSSKQEQNVQSTITSSSLSYKPEVLFDNQEIQQFLCGLGDSK